jgi:ribosome-binding factor A
VTDKRILRVGEIIRRELGFILDREIEDPRIGMITITRVELSDDLRYAKIYVGILGEDAEQKARLRLLRRAGRFLRSELAHRIDLRVAPELTFVIDDSAENYIRIAKLLKQIHDEDTRDGGEGPQGDRGGP